MSDVFERTEFGTTPIGGNWYATNHYPTPPGTGGTPDSGYAGDDGGGGGDNPPPVTPPPDEKTNPIPHRDHREIVEDYTTVTSQLRSLRLITTDTTGLTQQVVTDRPSDIDLERLMLAEIELLVKTMGLSRNTKNQLISKLRQLGVDEFAECLDSDALMLTLSSRDSDAFSSFSSSIENVASLNDVEDVILATIPAGSYYDDFIATPDGFFCLRGSLLYGWSDDTGWTLLEETELSDTDTYRKLYATNDGFIAAIWFNKVLSGHRYIANTGEWQTLSVTGSPASETTLNLSYDYSGNFITCYIGDPSDPENFTYHLNMSSCNVLGSGEWTTLINEDID